MWARVPRRARNLLSLSLSHEQVQRRLRLETARSEVGRLAQDMFGSADGDVMICLLTHKIIRALETEGLAEARMLLQVSGLAHKKHAPPMTLQQDYT